MSQSESFEPGASRMIPLSLGSIAGPSYRSRCQSSISFNARSSVVVLPLMAASSAPSLTLPLMTHCNGRSNGCPGGMGGGVFRSRRLLPDHSVSQHPDRLNLQLDDVAGAQVAIHLQAAPAADRSRAKKIAGIDGLPTRHMRDHLGKRPVNRPEPSSRPDFAVHPRDHDERAEVGDLIRGHKARADSRGEVLALGWPQTAGHFLELNVACAEVVHDRVAGDV